MTLPNLINDPDTVDMTELKRWREIRSNSRDALLAKNQNEGIDVDCTAGGTIVLTVSEREPVFHIRLTGSPGAGYTVEFADGNKQFLIENQSGQTATIDSSTGASSPIVVVDEAVATIQLRGVELTKTASIGLQAGALLHSGQVDPTGDFDFTDRKIQEPFLVDTAFEVTSPSSSSGTLTLDIENGNYFDVTLTEAVTTLDLNNPPVSAANISLEDGSGSLLLEDGSGFLILETSDAVGNVFLIARQDGTGGWAITFPASFVWEQDTGESPDQTTAPNAVDIYWFFTLDGGTTWYAHLLGLNMG